MIFKYISTPDGLNDNYKNDKKGICCNIRTQDRQEPDFSDNYKDNTRIYPFYSSIKFFLPLHKPDAVQGGDDKAYPAASCKRPERDLHLRQYPI